MEKVALDMKEKLKRNQTGELILKEKTKERFEKFIARYQDLKSKEMSSSNALQTSSLRDPANYEKINWFRQNRHKEEFKETRGLILGKTQEEREEVANHLRMEIADHESGSKKMDFQLYEFKKNALERYDRINHPKLIESTDEEAVSEGKTAETVDPETLAAPPRDKVSSNENDDKPASGVIVHGEEVKRRDRNEPYKSKEEKEVYRKKQAGKKLSKTLHDDGEENA